MLIPRRPYLAIVATLFAFAAAPARADVILTPGNVPQLDENVLLSLAGTGDPIFGLTNQTQLQVEFNSNETITAPAAGQARVEAVDQTLTQLAISVVGGSFTSLILNINALVSGTVNFTATDTQGDVFNFSQAVTAGGSNFFTFTTILGERLDVVSLLAQAPLSIVDVRQVRIGGAAADEGSVTVPEPTSLLLMGFAFVGVSLRRRKNQVRFSEL